MKPNEIKIENQTYRIVAVKGFLWDNWNAVEIDENLPEDYQLFYRHHGDSTLAFQYSYKSERIHNWCIRARIWCTDTPKESFPVLFRLQPA